MKKSTKIWTGITGALLVILGVVCLMHPGATLYSSSVLLGILTLASGISTFFMWARIKYFMPTGNLLLSAILQILMGIIFLNNSLLTAAALPIVFACWLFIEGTILAFRAFDFKAVNFKYWWVLLVFGILAALIGLYSITSLEVAATIMVYAIGIGIILIGLVDIIAIFGINKLEKRTFKWVDEQ